MKKNFPSLRSLFVKTSLFVGIFVILYSLFGVILLVHHHRSRIDSTLFRQAVELKRSIHDLKHKKDSLYQVGLKAPQSEQLKTRLYETDSILTKRQAEYDGVYSKANVKRLNAQVFHFMGEMPLFYLKLILKPTLPIIPPLCFLLSLILYRPVRLNLNKRLGWLNLET